MDKTSICMYRNHFNALHSCRQDLQLGEFSFFYNSVASRNPSQFESLIGSGICSIVLTLVGVDGRVLLRVPSNGSLVDNSSYGHFNCSDLDVNLFSGNGSDCTEEIHLLIEIWSHGSLNLLPLFDFIFKSISDVCYDYISEV
jgi:hypothetical protein